MRKLNVAVGALVLSVASLTFGPAFADPAVCNPYVQMWRGANRPSVAFSKELLRNVPVSCAELRTTISGYINDKAPRPPVTVTDNTFVMVLNGCKKYGSGAECEATVTARRSGKYRFKAARLIGQTASVWTSSISIGGVERSTGPQQVYGWMREDLISDVPIQVIFKFDNVLDPAQLPTLDWDRVVFRDVPWS